MTLLVLLIKGCKSPAFDQAHESPPPAFTLSGWTCADGRRTRIKHGELVYSLIKGYPQVAPISGGAQARPLTAKLWSLTDMVRVIEDWEAARSAKISGGTVIG